MRGQDTELQIAPESIVIGEWVHVCWAGGTSDGSIGHQCVVKSFEELKYCKPKSVYHSMGFQ